MAESDVNADDIAQQMDVVTDLIRSLEAYLLAMGPASPSLDRACALLREVPDHVEQHLYRETR